jgi:hypothetical protein
MANQPRNTRGPAATLLSFLRKDILPLLVQPTPTEPQVTNPLGEKLDKLLHELNASPEALTPLDEPIERLEPAATDQPTWAQERAGLEEQVTTLRNKLEECESHASATITALRIEKTTLEGLLRQLYSDNPKATDATTPRPPRPKLGRPTTFDGVTPMRRAALVDWTNRVQAYIDVVLAGQSDELMLNELANFFVGPAATWYIDARASSKFTSVSDALDLLARDFTDPNDALLAKSEWAAVRLMPGETPFNLVIRLRAIATRCRGGKSERAIYERFITAIGPYGHLVEAKIHESNISSARDYNLHGLTPPTVDEETEARHDLTAAIAYATAAISEPHQGGNPRAKMPPRPATTKSPTSANSPTPSRLKSPTPAGETWLAKAMAFQAAHPISAKPWPEPRTIPGPTILARMHCWNCGRTGHASTLCEEERRDPKLVAQEIFQSGKE